MFPVIAARNCTSGIAEWTFLTNHAHALLCIAQDREFRLRDVAERVGRRNYYRIRDDRPLRHPVERGHRIGEILAVLHDHEGADGVA